MAQKKDSFVPETEQAQAPRKDSFVPDKKQPSNIQTAPTPSGGETQRIDIPTDAVNRLVEALASIAVEKGPDLARQGISLGVGTLALLATKSPSASALATSIVDYAMKKGMGEQTGVNLGFPGLGSTTIPAPEGPIAEPLFDIAGNALANRSFEGVFNAVGKALRGGVNAVKSFAPATNISGTAAFPVPPTMAERLKPTYGQMNPDSIIKEIENIALPTLKAESVQRSTKLSKDVAQDVASDLSGGTRITRLVDEPVKTRQRFAAGVENQSERAFRAFIRESNLQADNVRNIANQNIAHFPINVPTPTGMRQGMYAVEGPINPKNIVDKAIELRNKIESLPTKPDPNSPVLNDLNGIIQSYAEIDPLTGKVLNYKPVSFKDAWATKQELADKGWGNPDRTEINHTYTQYKDLFKAFSSDIETGVGSWTHRGKEALKSYNEARRLVGARIELWEGGANLKKIINLADNKTPIPAIDRILDDEKELPKFLLQNEYKLADGRVVTGGNKRGLLKSYQFMRMWEDANKFVSANDIEQSKVAVQNFTNNWNRYKTSVQGTTLYNKADIARVDEFADAIQTALTLEGSKGVSKYLGVRLASEGFKLGVGGLAYIFAGGPLMTGSLIGSASLAGAILTARQVGKILLQNPDAAQVLNKMALGKPLGRSAMGASQILAYALRNETIKIVTEGGQEIAVQLDGQGKVKDQLANLNLGRPEVEIKR